MSSVRDDLDGFFVERPWRGKIRRQVMALWAWRSEVRALFRSDSRPGVEDTVRAGESLETGRATGLIPPEIEDLCLESLRMSGTEFGLLARCWAALADEHRLLIYGNDSALRENTSMLAGSFASLVASCAGIKGNWRRNAVTDCARAHFLAKRLFTIRDDALECRTCFPLSDMEHFGVKLSDLGAGINDPGTRKLLWQQTVRIRDSVAGTVPLIRDLSRRDAAYMKRWWFVVLEIIQALERTGFDIPSPETTFGISSRAQIALQSRFGGATFR